jgi:osmoprotectant transport system permease protein
VHHVDRTAARDRVVLTGVITGLVSCFLNFVVLKPNRIASGTGLSLWNTFQAGGIVFILLWSAALTLYLITGKKSSAFINGITGTVVIIAVFFMVGRATQTLLSSEFPFARVSMAFGSWLMILSGYILIHASVRTLTMKDPKAVALVLIGPVAVILFFVSGYLHELSIVKEYLIRRDRFFGEFVRHLTLSGSAVLLGIAIGTPLGVLAFRRRALQKPAFFFVNTVQTIPSLALFGIMIAPLSILSQRFPLLREIGIKGIGSAPALIALTLYALLPITRNTYTSLRVIDRSVVESALGMGMSRLQVLISIEAPLALPVIMSGIRTSTVQAIGNTTVAALIGAGGFGVFVFQGLGQAVPDLIMLGAFPVILLAVAADKLMQMLVRALTPRGLRFEQGDPS